ncbi:Putative ribosomal N-acetyltransferase YdaF [Flavobacterium longum]|uniref:GNAT family N-acetyltransferase n=1 Tax=Flavobacterium longum TaxID=1299340 RepID=UPI0039ECE450
MAFEFNQNLILEDDLVLLRPLQLDDIEHLVSFSENETAIWKFSSLPVIGRTNFTEYIRLAVENRSKQTEFPFIVFDKRTSEYAGSTRFYDIQLANETLQLGYTWYGERFHGTGLNKHCKFLLLSYAFEEMGMARVEFRANNLNKHSIAAMISIGCTVEGVLRSNMKNIDGTRRDSIILSILKDEWFERVKPHLTLQLL